MAPDSTSSPFLAIARAHGVPYGQVLAYMDLVRCVRASQIDVWMDEAVHKVPERTRTAIREAWTRELELRKAPRL